MRKIVGGAALATLGLLAVSCSDDGNNNSSPGGIDGAEGVITPSADIPDVDGVDLYEPEDDRDAMVMMCQAADWWLNPETSPEGREQAAPFLLSVAQDEIGSDFDALSDVSDSVTMMVRGGYTVDADRLNMGQEAAYRSCGLGM